MNNVLIITFGNRDGMFVYKEKGNNSKNIRMKVNQKYDFERGYQDAKWFSTEDTSEVTFFREMDNYKDLPFAGITFPMFEKTIRELQKQKIKIDSLYVISTDRSQLIPKLNEIKDYLSEDTNYKNSYEYTHNIISFIHQDCSSIYSDALKHHLEQILKEKNINKISEVVFSVFTDNTKLNFLKIGEGYTGFNDITLTNVMRKHSEGEIIKLLSKVDFNNEYFFFPALNEKFYREYCLSKLKNTNIFYLSLSGGIPVMQLTLLTVLDSVFPDKQKNKIYFPEKQNFSFQFSHIDYYNLFRIRRLVSFYLEKNDLEKAKETINELKMLKIPTNIIEKIREIENEKLFEEKEPEKKKDAILFRIDQIINKQDY